VYTAEHKETTDVVSSAATAPSPEQKTSPVVDTPASQVNSANIFMRCWDWLKAWWWGAVQPDPCIYKHLKKVLITLSYYL